MIFIHRHRGQKEIIFRHPLRYHLRYTIAGTRTYHFVPSSNNAIKFKRPSEDEKFSGCYEFYQLDDRPETIKLSLNEYVVAFYGGNWWVGIVTNLNENEEEAKVKFMAPHGPALLFH